MLSESTISLLRRLKLTLFRVFRRERELAKPRGRSDSLSREGRFFGSKILFEEEGNLDPEPEVEKLSRG